jgi:hypothetical protein
MVKTRAQENKEQAYKASKKCTVIGDQLPLLALPVPIKRPVASICVYRNVYHKKCRNYASAGNDFCHPHMTMDKNKRDRHMRLASAQTLEFPDRVSVHTILPPPIGTPASEWKPRVFEWKECTVCKTYRLEDNNGCKTCRLWSRLTGPPQNIPIVQIEPESPELVWEALIEDNFKAIRSPLPKTFTQEETVAADSMLQLSGISRCTSV